MKQNVSIFLGIAIILILSSTLFTLQMTQSAIILEFQKPKEIMTEPGLYIKIPFIQEVKYFSNQLLDNDSPPMEVITKDKKNLLIDNFTVWRIVDPLKFLETVRDENGSRARLNDIIYSELRVEIGTHDLIDIVTETRETIMEKVSKEAALKASEYGIEVVEVRIKRTDLPQDIAASIYRRMRTERERIAKEYRSEGEEEALKIRAETDKQKTILIAEAYKTEQAVRGEGDGASIKIYADAFNKDPKFYSFIRSMEAYKKSLKTGTTILMSEESDFLDFLNNPN
jgi:membrane protease subunit HflC